MLWIDGVGAYLVCCSPQVTVGGPASGPGSADIELLANLSRLHATFVRSGEGYLLEAHSATKVAGRLVQGRTPLNDKYEIELGESVRLRFNLPTVLSATATIGFESDHRPSRSVAACCPLMGSLNGRKKAAASSRI